MVGFPELGWSVASAILSGISALVLHRWRPQWSIGRRTLIATALALAPTATIVGWAIGSKGNVLFSMSLDELWIPLTIQIAMILVVALPVSWFVSQRKHGARSLSDIFD